MEYIHDSTAYPSMDAPAYGLGGGLSLVEELMWLVYNALYAAKELNAVLSYEFPMFHQLAMDLLF